MPDSETARERGGQGREEREVSTSTEAWSAHFLSSLSLSKRERDREGRNARLLFFFFLAVARSGSDFLHHTLEEKSWSREKLGAQKRRLSNSKALENRRSFFDHRSIFLKERLSPPCPRQGSGSSAATASTSGARSTTSTGM